MARIVTTPDGEESWEVPDDPPIPATDETTGHQMKRKSDAAASRKRRRQNPKFDHAHAVRIAAAKAWGEDAAKPAAKRREEMKQKKVWRYYCEFCKKATCTKSSMTRHERGCTNNPNRVCGLCPKAELTQMSKPELDAALAISLEALRDIASGCPACMLATIRQSRKPGETPNDEGYIWYEFNWKEEHDRFWANTNDAHPEYR